ncbi:MAG: GNAT family protein [bacterium]|nr:GNAT family protein [bacterium]
MKDPFLTGEHVYLRTIKKSDLNESYREWFNDEEVCKYNSHHKFPNYDENMHDYYENVIKSRANLVLAICDKETDKHIGNIALENIDSLNQSAEFAIVIGDKSQWGRGVGKEAAKLILRHGFEELNLHRIYCGTSVANTPMQKLALSLGMKEEGRRAEAMYKNGAYADIVEYGLVRENFVARGSV